MKVKSWVFFFEGRVGFFVPDFFSKQYSRPRMFNRLKAMLPIHLLHMKMHTAGQS